jgi:PAS domain S-box
MPENMLRHRSDIFLPVCIVMMLAITVFKYLYPELIYFNSGFVLVIMFSIFLKKDIYPRLFGIMSVAIILLWLVFFTSQPDAQLIISQLLAIIVIICSTVLVTYIRKLYKSIESEKRQMNALFEYATEGIILTNKKGEIQLVNPAALQLFGYKKEELLGESIEILIPERFHAKHTQYREGFYEKPGNRSMGRGRDLFGRTKEGRELPLEVSLSFFTQQNEFYVIAFIVDITQRKEAERKMIEQNEQLEKITEDIRKLNMELESKVEERTLILKEALHELEQSQQDLSEALSKEKELNEIKSRFVSMASHEFRTPLSTVLSSAALLARYTTTEEQDKRERHIRRIRDSVKHLNDLLEDFLSLGKLEEGKVHTKPETVEIKEFLDEVAEEIKAISKQGQQINVSIDGKGNFITDKKLLRNILINLLSNAVKFSAEDGTIQLNASCHDHQLSIAVKDNGIGISEEDQQHLFSSFFRGKNALNIQGTGLGLHIVKRYVELLHGDIQFESKLNAGTKVTITLRELHEQPAEEPAL